MYINWDKKAVSIYPFYWVTVPALIDYLHELYRFIIFSRDNTFESTLPILPETIIPCSKNERLPNGVNFLCETSGWRADMDLLQLAVGALINKKKLDRKYPFFKTAGEAEYFAYQKIHCILRFLLDEPNSIVNQETFERFYGLVWED